ncbi:MAG: mechanosensitive ion channel family protein [Eubacterium sp.]
MNNIINYITEMTKHQDKIFNIILGVVILILLTALRNKLSKGILNVTGKILFKHEEKAHKRESLNESLQKPLSMFFVILGIFICLYINIHITIVLKSFKIATILIICWATVNYLSNNLFLLFHFGEDADNKMNTTAIKFITNILKILVIAFAVVMVISELGYNINGLITGLGVGGLAVSLAAQEAISNLISGFIIVFEKPFIVGDMIQTSTIQGVVEEVTMRSTKIRTLEDSVVTIPNSTLADDAIINISRMDKRLINLEFGLIYSTSNDLMKKCQDDIEKYLTDDANILESPIRVNFSKLDDSSLNIAITCYTATSDINEYLKILSNVNYKIKEIIERNGAEFAYPSSSIYIEKQ